MVEGGWVSRGLLYPSMNLRMRLVLPELGLPITIRSILTFPIFSDYYVIIYNPPEWQVNTVHLKAVSHYKITTQSVSPGLLAGVAAHKASHRLIRSTYLFLVFAVGHPLVTVSTLFTCILIDKFLHIVVETRPASL